MFCPVVSYLFSWFFLELLSSNTTTNSKFAYWITSGQRIAVNLELTASLGAVSIKDLSLYFPNNCKTTIWKNRYWTHNFIIRSRGVDLKFWSYRYILGIVHLRKDAKPITVSIICPIITRNPSYNIISTFQSYDFSFILACFCKLIYLDSSPPN